MQASSEALKAKCLLAFFRCMHISRCLKYFIRNYLPNDEESKHCATLLQWDNIYYQPPTDSYVERLCPRKDNRRADKNMVV